VLVQFKPALGLNPAIQQAYAANRLRVVRQVHHSLNNAQDAVDLVLFVNGIAVATAELKSDFTQSVGDAVDQYRFDRDPAPGRSGGAAAGLPGRRAGAFCGEPVGGDDEHPAGRHGDRFLPFNQGNAGGAGNPPNPFGFATWYLWQEVWQRDSWLEILGRYLVGERNDKKQLTGVIFPRYHQLDATRKLVADVLEHGVGERYLIQHSAGSGKTNSIAWTAHFLADLHDAAHRKLFDSVLVVSDRTVLDDQLQEAIFDFQRTTGVVATITDEHGSKSAQLSQALKDGKKIIVCTIQTFPFALKAVQELAATEGKRFAVIADEAHSSQTGEAAAKLKQVLSADELAELQDGGEIDTEALLAAQMSAKAAQDKGSPTSPSPPRPSRRRWSSSAARTPTACPALPCVFDAPGDRGGFHPRRAEELHDLQARLQAGQQRQGVRREGGGEVRGAEGDHAVGAPAPLQHQPEGAGGGGALPRQRAAAARRPGEGDDRGGQPPGGGALAEGDHRLHPEAELPPWRAGGVLGEIDDPRATRSPSARPARRSTPASRATSARRSAPGYHLLLVANKFQTGFDQPLLCGMYVDKRLAGIQAVQTLSRLNRAHPGKDTTYILDFVNDAEEVLAAFKTYYETARLEANTDPNLVFDLRAKLDATGFYDSFEVDRVAQIETDPKGTQAQLSAALAPVADRLLKRYKALQAQKAAAEAGHDGPRQAAQDALEVLVLFKGDMGAFCRLYAFLSQIFDYGNTDIEKRFLFYKRLIPCSTSAASGTRWTSRRWC
jgi:type I restriction enzyme R subunit